MVKPWWQEWARVSAEQKTTPKTAAIVVAHPDDEVIWCGGMLLQNPDWSWTVLCFCRGSDGDRRPKFERVCERLGARGIILDVDDGNPPAPIDPAAEIGHPIREHLCGRAWDLCLTHGANGEYGHPRHQQVHAEVCGLVDTRDLDCRELWTFAYACDAQTGLCRPSAEADVLLELTDEQLAEKKRIVNEIYGYRTDVFEYRACVSPEGFCRRDRRT